VTVRILMGIKEVALHIGVKNQRVVDLWHEHAAFPKPLDILHVGPVWWAEDIEEFAKIPRPVGRPKKSTCNTDKEGT